MAKRSPTTREQSRSQVKRKSKRRTKVNRNYTLPFQSQHYILFGVGLLIILAGFFTLGFGSITLAPFLMVLGYCVIIPFLFFWKASPGEKRIDTDESAH